ncbi:hypothetical protein GCM10027343_24710 [Noviherbaspirillum agri]
MRTVLLGAIVFLAGCTPMQAQPPGSAGGVRGDAVSQESLQGEQGLVAAFSDQGRLKQLHPQAELLGTYGEVTIWRVLLTPQQWSELAALGRYSPVFGEGQGRWRALPGGVIVRLAPSLQGQKADEWFRSRQLSAKPLSTLPGTYVVDTPPGVAALELSRQLGALPDVVRAEPNWWREYSLRK